MINNASAIKYYGFEFRIEDWFLEVELLGQMIWLKRFWYILSVLFPEKEQNISAGESSAQLEDENHLERKAVFTPGILWKGETEPLSLS